LGLNSALDDKSGDDDDRDRDTRIADNMVEVERVHAFCGALTASKITTARWLASEYDWPIEYEHATIVWWYAKST